MWFRQHRILEDYQDNGCWWHASLPNDPKDEPGGRFDLASPDGTCYLAATDRGAVLEHVGRFLARHIPIPPEAYAERGVSEVRLPLLNGPAADLTSPDSAQVGVTSEIHTVDDYRLTTEWAAAARRDGFGALRYQTRFGQDVALALFGPAGAYPDRGVLSTRPLVDVLVELGYKTNRSTPPSTATISTRTEDDAEPEDA